MPPMHPYITSCDPYNPFTDVYWLYSLACPESRPMYQDTVSAVTPTTGMPCWQYLRNSYLVPTIVMVGETEAERAGTLAVQECFQAQAKRFCLCRDTGSRKARSASAAAAAAKLFLVLLIQC